jgi:hypothetical protein
MLVVPDPLPLSVVGRISIGVGMSRKAGPAAPAKEGTESRFSTWFFEQHLRTSDPPARVSAQLPAQPGRLLARPRSAGSRPPGGGAGGGDAAWVCSRQLCDLIATECFRMTV